MADFPTSFDYAFTIPRCGPYPVYIATYGFASSAFARHYSRTLGWFLFLQVLRCFSSLGSLRNTMDSCYVSWLFAMSVSTFGNLRIEAYLQLPAAYRSLSRPSSAPDAKAFALCSYSLELSYQWFLSKSLGSLRSLNCLSFIKTFFRLFLSLQLKDFPFVHWFFPPFGEIVFFIPYFLTERPILIS